MRDIAYSRITHERKHLKWFAEASVLCNRKQRTMKHQKFDDLYTNGEKWKIKDCAFASALDKITTQA